MGSRFTMAEHPSRAGWFRIKDSLWGIHCDFEGHRFNDTQEFPNADKLPKDALVVARIMREIGEWVLLNHPDKAF